MIGFIDFITNLRWHYPDQVIRVFLSLHKEGHPESNKKNQKLAINAPH